MPVTVDIVVESKLLVLLYIATCEDTHSNVTPNSPFRHITIRSAAVVQKTTYPASLGCIDILSDG